MRRELLELDNILLNAVSQVVVSNVHESAAAGLCVVESNFVGSLAAHHEWCSFVYLASEFGRDVAQLFTCFTADAAAIYPASQAKSATMDWCLEFQWLGAFLSVSNILLVALHVP